MAKHAKSAAPMVTSEMPFFPLGGAPALFAVRDGVPVLTALEQASCFLGTACEIAHGEMSEQASCGEYWAMAYSLDLAKAVLDSVVRTMLDEAAASYQQGATQ